MRLIVAALAAAGGVGIALWVIFGPQDKPPDKHAHEPQYVQCEACKRSRELTLEEMSELFPRLAMNPLGPQPKRCSACGRQAVYPALKCPRDGTVFIWRAAEVPALAPCPKCGWTRAREIQERRRERGRGP